jgi:hypothetical protein
LWRSRSKWRSNIKTDRKKHVVKRDPNGTDSGYGTVANFWEHNDCNWSYITTKERNVAQSGWNSSFLFERSRV